MTGYGRRGRPRRSAALPTRGAAARPEVRERLARRVTLAVLYARAIVIREDQGSGELVADPDPRVVDFVAGDAFDQARDQPFTAMYFQQEPPATLEEVGRNLDEYVATKQAALEQATDRPPRPYVQRRRQAVVVENLGSPSGAVIVGYLFRFYHEYAKGTRIRAPTHETTWTIPSGRLRREQEQIMGAERVRLAFAVYERLRPSRGPL